MPHLKKKFVIIRMSIIIILTICGLIGTFIVRFKEVFIYEPLAMLYLSLVLQLHFSLFMSNSQFLLVVMNGFKKNFRKVIMSWH